MPEANQVHIDAALTNLSVAYRNNQFIAEQIAPRVGVRKQSDKYFIYDTEREAMRARADHRAPGSLADEVNYAISTDSYYCSDHALAAAIPDEERDNADTALQPDMDRTEYLTERLLLNQEMALETMMRTSLLIPETSPTPGAEWNDPTGDPVADINTARLAIFGECQRNPNVLVLPPTVFDALRTCPAIVDRIRFSSLGVVTEELLARLMDVERVIVPRSFINTAPQGKPPEVQGLWANNAYLLYVAPRPGLKQLTFANTFVWNGMAGSADGTVVERWRDHGRKADMVRVQKYYDTKLIAPGAACRITSVIA